jgi:hypothetical protein
MLAIVNFIEGLNAFYFSSEMTKSINDKRYKAMFIIYIHIYVCGCVWGGVKRIHEYAYARNIQICFIK